MHITLTREEWREVYKELSRIVREGELDEVASVASLLGDYVAYALKNNAELAELTVEVDGRTAKALAGVSEQWDRQVLAAGVVMND